jgi:hypothetical protein
MAKLLEGTTLDDIRTKQSITVLKETASVEQALKARGGPRGGCVVAVPAVAVGCCCCFGSSCF